MQKILLIEYHRNLSTGFIIEPQKEVMIIITSFCSGQIIYFSLPVGKPNQLILPQLLQQLQ